MHFLTTFKSTETKLKHNSFFNRNPEVLTRNKRAQRVRLRCSRRISLTQFYAASTSQSRREGAGIELIWKKFRWPKGKLALADDPPKAHTRTKVEDGSWHNFVARRKGWSIRVACLFADNFKSAADKKSWITSSL